MAGGVIAWEMEYVGKNQRNKVRLVFKSSDDQVIKKNNQGERSYGCRKVGDYSGRVKVP